MPTNVPYDMIGSAPARFTKILSIVQNAIFVLENSRENHMSKDSITKVEIGVHHPPKTTPINTRFTDMKTASLENKILYVARMFYLY